MYRKVIADDGDLESMNDKRTMCMLLTKALLNILETFRSKIFSFSDIDRLEEMVRFGRDIKSIVYKAVTEVCGIEYSPFCPKHSVFFPLIRQARQFEIHSILCFMASLLNTLKKKKYFMHCRHIGVMDKFVKLLQPSRIFLDKFLVGNAHFHEVVPPKPKCNAHKRYEQKYY